MISFVLKNFIMCLDVGTKMKTLGKTMVNVSGRLHLINQDTVRYGINHLYQ